MFIAQFAKLNTSERSGSSEAYQAKAKEWMDRTSRAVSLLLKKVPTGTCVDSIGFKDMAPPAAQEEFEQTLMKRKDRDFLCSQSLPSPKAQKKLV